MKPIYNPERRIKEIQEERDDVKHAYKYKRVHVGVYEDERIAYYDKLRLLDKEEQELFHAYELN